LVKKERTFLERAYRIFIINTTLLFGSGKCEILYGKYEIMLDIFIL